MPMAWHERLKRGWGNVMLAHEAASLDRLQKQAALVNRLVRKTQNGTLGRPTVEAEDAEGDEMGVRIGDETHFYAAPPNHAPRAIGWALAAATALLTGGAGLVTGWLLHEDLSSQSVPAPVEAADRLEYDFRLVRPAE